LFSFAKYNLCKIFNLTEYYAGGKHEFLVKGELRFILPNPHQSEISKDLLARLLRQANLTREEWEKL
jgi:hypothetical protein